MSARFHIPFQTKPAFSFISLAPALLQRKCGCSGSAASGGCEKCSEKNLAVQRSTQNSERETQNAGAVPPIVSEVLRSPGQPLDRQTRAFFEPRFGHDFSRVRVHADANAAASAAAVNALAYTVGRDVAFGAGQYAPETSAGRKLLAHELTHVVQQGSSSTAGIGGNGISPQTASRAQGALEGEADRMAEGHNWHAASAAGSSQSSQGILQRQGVPETEETTAPATTTIPASDAGTTATATATPAADAGATAADAGTPAAAVCPVAAITPYGPPDGPPVGNAGMTAATVTAMDCLQTAVTTAGGTMHVTTRFRSQAYQDHLVDVWDKCTAPAPAGPQCEAVRTNYATERATHFPMGAPARGVSNHTNGTAFDATVTLPAGQNINTIQAGCNLTRPVPGEPWHFET
jgi:hypothetical protein